jgi:hypothetical protein
LGIWAVGLLAFGLAAAISASRVPEPRVHDEFSNLLAADTFSSGRLTNPTHPLWQHFETFHVIHQPSYMSKYPPAQGLALAFGQLWGHPIVGAWLATAFAVAACCWMFQGWMPGRWALAGAGFVALHHGVQFYWGQSYWGGALAMAGGALLFGAWVRLRRTPSAKHAVVLALGVALLANTRPFEGLVACLAVGVSLLRVWLGGRASNAQWLRSVLAPALVVWVLVGSAMLGYNAALTGDPLQLPYQLQERSYSPTPLFLWQDLRPEPPYRHDAIRDFYRGWVLNGYTQRQSLGFAILDGSRVVPFFWTPMLALALVPFPWIFRSPRMRFAGTVLLASFAATWVIPWEARSHYLSAVAALFFVVPLQGLRQIAQWPRWGFPAVVLLAVGHAAIFLAAALRYPELERPSWAAERVEIQNRLHAAAGQHLVLVRYGAGHDPHVEWVWNAADIDAAPIVWSRSWGESAEREIRAYFPNRRVWELHADERPARLVELNATP